MTTLYEKLGGAAGISRIVDDLVDAHLRNPTIQARFRPFLEKPDRVAEIKQHNRDFLGAGTGGPEVYTGKSMLESHRGMNINEAEYMAVMDDILFALEKNGIDESARKDVLAIAFGLKGDIIRR
jgi:hemoglobin